MIWDTPKFLKVRGEASFPELAGIVCIINYGYSGTQGVWCEQQ